MIVVMKRLAGDVEINAVVDKLERAGFILHISKGVEHCVIGVVGDKTRICDIAVEAMPGVDKVVSVLSPYKLVSRAFKSSNTIVRVGNIEIGGNRVHIMAGPCAIESKSQLLLAAQSVKEAGATILRGGAYKPRTSPYSFQGLMEKGLEFLAEAREKTGLPVVTELMDARLLPLLDKYVDIIQIGARNMQNYSLLREVAGTKKPVLLKRGHSATIEEWLLAAEYIMSGGNDNIILCERGVRTFETYTRNTLDLSSVAIVKYVSHLPVIVDPSHALGKWRFVTPMSKAAIACGADGLLVEVHPNPQEALCDGPQSLNPAAFKSLMESLTAVAEAVGRTL